MPTNFILESKRLTVMPFTEEFLTERYVSWLNDPEVVRYSSQRFKKHTIETCRQYVKSFEGTPNGFWVILAKDKKLGAIGTMTSYVNIHDVVVDIGILIGEKSIWGQSYGLEAWVTLCHEFLHHRKVRKITAGTLFVNQGMLNIMKKSGMREDGLRKKQCMIDGKEIDMIYAAFFQGDTVKGR